MSASDYTNMRRFKQLTKPMCTYEITTRCDDHQNRINCFYPQNDTPTNCEQNEKCGDKITSNSKIKYIITPINDGSVTFTVDRGLLYTSGTNVFCSKIDAPNTYFEGVVYNYNCKTGEITIYHIQNVNGIFKDPAIYNVILLAGSQELTKLRTRVNELYKMLFKIDLTDSSNSNYDLALNKVHNEINILYIYFYDIDIRTQEVYEFSYTFLNLCINELYEYFFDIENIDAPANKYFNPNNNNVLLNTIENKVSQLYLYFFDNDLSTQLTFSPL